MGMIYSSLSPDEGREQRLAAFYIAWEEVANPTGARAAVIHKASALTKNPTIKMATRPKGRATSRTIGRRWH
jgi:hypothetical protein